METKSDINNLENINTFLFSARTYSKSLKTQIKTPDTNSLNLSDYQSKNFNISLKNSLSENQNWRKLYRLSDNNQQCQFTRDYIFSAYLFFQIVAKSLSKDNNNAQLQKIAEVYSYSGDKWEINLLVNNY